MFVQHNRTIILKIKRYKMKVISTEKVPIKMWLQEIEEGAVNQCKNLANLPFIFKHLAIMPDSHQGYGMPIGGVLATKGVVIPNAVGVDIGCGMCAAKTGFKDINTVALKEILTEIRKVVPVGFHHQESPQEEWLNVSDKAVLMGGIIEQEYRASLQQLGTLGGGNHFIEIQKGSDGYIWIMLHSGSRNLGKKVADFYNKMAIELNQMWFSKVEKNIELAFLPLELEIAQDYLKEMQFCVDFAFKNRQLMMRNIINCFERVIAPDPYGIDIINIAHNYARMENHYGENVLIHRKGAVSASLGKIGIIAGSQGTKSYIVEGLGNPESFMSCSHGAGRKMGRKQAIKELSLASEVELLNSQGIIHSLRYDADLDEASGAFKDIDVVMANQCDLVKVLVELKPLAVIKAQS